MNVVKPSFEILRPTSIEEGIKTLQFIEDCARVCYKSEGMKTEVSWMSLITKLLEKKHFPMFDHGSMSVKFVTSRGIGNELTRHRMAAFAQISTRYCNFSKDKFGSEITVIQPSELTKKEDIECWTAAMLATELAYMQLLKNGHTAQIARDVLPLCLQTEIIMTADLTEWHHVFKLRTAKAAHPHMRELMIPLLMETRKIFPLVFDDITVEA